MSTYRRIATGLVLLVTIGLGSLGVPAQLYANSGDYQGLVNYQIVAAHSLKCLNVSGASTTSGAQVIQWTCVGASNQKWYLEQVEPGYYYIRALHSNMCLNVKGASTTSGALIIQHTCNRELNEEWYLVVSGDMPFHDYQIRARHSGQCLDVTRLSTDDGAEIQQHTCNGGSNQLWSFDGMR